MALKVWADLRNIRHQMGKEAGSFQLRGDFSQQVAMEGRKLVQIEVSPIITLFNISYSFYLYQSV